MQASRRCGAGARASRLHPPTRCLPRLACRRAARPRSRRTGLRGRRLIWPRPAVAGGASPSVSYPGKRAVMIGAVVVLATATGNDTPCATVAHSRRSDRVFAVIPAVSDRQELFPVREHPPVLRVREWSARLDESERAARLGRKLLEAYFGAARSREPEEGESGEREAQVLGASGSTSRNLRPSSSSCYSSTGLGARTSRSCAHCVLGKAITSGMESAPAMSATMRSRPKAMPPCGGAPYWRLSSRKPNLL